MNRNTLKHYAPQARRDFIAAVTDRAAYYGLTTQKLEPMTEQGEVALIGGKPFPRSVAAKRKRLEERIRRQGFEQVMEAMAYTWFNRLGAIRYMELHGYLEHGYRVLSHPEGKAIPEILEHAEHVDLPRLDTRKVIELKLDGTREAELYRMLLIAQCNALHSAMPFLFERIDDETELLLPDNLLHSDSLIRKLVNSINEGDWQEVEIIGWLYQFYISEKKDQVIGKVVKSEDIPAATQLFTPNWIVKYLVQNSVGRQWTATYPNSPLKQQMEYYIEPAEQTPEVQEQLKAITPDSLNPEELTLLDPACGSGHILVEAYDLLKAIYQERGYRLRDIPRLILEKNLYGLEIDDRAAQLSAFALMMKARADDRRIFSSGIQPHVLAIQESKGLDATEITEALNTPILKEALPPSAYLFEEIEEEKSPLLSRQSLSVKGDISGASVAQLLDLFEHGKTFGSLIRVPEELAEKLPAIAQRVADVLAYGGMLEQVAAMSLMPLVEQSSILGGYYENVVTNPPYMGNGFFNPALKRFVVAQYPYVKADLYACFLVRNLESLHTTGFLGMITIPNWMFLSAFTDLRHLMLNNHTIETLTHNGRGVWGADFGSCSFIIRRTHISKYQGIYKRLFDKGSSVPSQDTLVERFLNVKPFVASERNFKQIPTSPIAYWATESTLHLFGKETVADYTFSEGAVKTGNNDRFLRLLWEIDSSKIHKEGKWRKHPKGGDYRRWYGNVEWLVDWSEDARSHYRSDKIARILTSECWDLEAICWTAVSIGEVSFRLLEEEEVANNAALSLFPNDSAMLYVLLGFMNSKVADYLLKICSPTVNYLVGDIQRLPFIGLLDGVHRDIERLVTKAINVSHDDWDERETSFGFRSFPICGHAGNASTIEQALLNWNIQRLDRIELLKKIETDINRLFIKTYRLEGELSHEVPEEEIRLHRPDREEDIKLLISYAIGCMMGRYSLDKPGLIYARNSNKGFDSSQYPTFPADADGIIPLTELEWFDDDAANRLEQFIATAWAREHLEENLKFIADSLGPNRNEQPRDAIRRYVATGFYKHHLSMYKRRPIYWLFSSGKQRAFQCLVYLHRYHEGTFSRMRTEYVIPLQGKLSSRIAQLADDIAAASATSHRKKLEKERDTLVRQQAELHTFDEKLRHHADRRISLDLDDGVKVNYGKFGDLLAEVNTVTGGTMDGDS